jgi:hypothetical protein
MVALLRTSTSNKASDKRCLMTVIYDARDGEVQRFRIPDDRFSPKVTSSTGWGVFKFLQWKWVHLRAPLGNRFAVMLLHSLESLSPLKVRQAAMLLSSGR